MPGEFGRWLGSRRSPTPAAARIALNGGQLALQRAFSVADLGIHCLAYPGSAGLGRAATVATCTPWTQFIEGQLYLACDSALNLPLSVLDSKR